MTDDLIKRVADRLGYVPYTIEWTNRNRHNHQGADIPVQQEDKHENVLRKTYHPIGDLKYCLDCLPPWLTSVDAALGVLDKKRYFSMIWNVARQEWCVGYTDTDQEYEHECLPHAICEAFLEVGDKSYAEQVKDGDIPF